MDSIPSDSIIEPEQPEEQENEPDSEADPSTLQRKAGITSKAPIAKSAISTKKPLTTGAPKRPTTVSASTSSLKSATTITKPPTGSTLSKPPTRPSMPSSAPRRPPTSSTSTPQTTRTRQAVTPSQDPKDVSSNSTGPKRTMAAGTARRASLAPSTVAKAAGSTSEPAALRRAAAVPTVEKKPLSSSTKPLASPKVSTLSTPRTIRSSTVSSTSSRPGAAQDGKKRLSTIPASPAVQVTSATDKLKRPPLGQRKSTMSIDLQQKLREMELVHQMLRIAMAQDGDDGDELKQEYAEKMDKSLAELREQLKDSAGAEESKSDPVEGKKDEDNTTTLQTELAGLKERLEVSEEDARKAAGDSRQLAEEARAEYELQRENQKALHEAELSKLSDRFRKQQENLDNDKAALQQQHDRELEALKTSHEHQLDQLRAQVAEKDDNHQELRENSLKDIEKAKTMALEQSSRDITLALAEQQQHHLTKLQTLQEQLETQTKEASSAKSSLETLNSTVADLQNRLSEAESSVSKESTSKDELAESIQKLQGDIAGKEEQLTSTISELQSLRTLHATQLKEVEELRSSSNTAASKQRDLLTTKDNELRKLRSEIKELEAVSATMATARQEAETSKASELEKVRQDLDALTKERDSLKNTITDSAALLTEQEVLNEEIARLKFTAQESDTKAAKEAESLSKAHESRVNDLQNKIRTAEDESDALKAALEELRERGLIADDLQKRISELEDTLKDAEDRNSEQRRAMTEDFTKHREELSSKHNAELEASLLSKDREHKIAIEELTLQHHNATEAALLARKIEHASNLSEEERKRETLQNENKALRDAIDSMNTKSSKAADKLLAEKRALEKTRSDTKQELDDATAQLTGLKKMLETFDQESIEKDHQHESALQKIKIELQRANKSLDEKTEELEQKLVQHSALTDSLKKGHNEAISKLQATNTAQSESLESLRVDHTEQMEKLKGEHAILLEKNQTIHDEALDKLQRKLNDSEIRLSDAIDSEKQSKAGSINELEKRHATEIKHIRDQLTAANKDLTSKTSEQDSLHQSLKSRIAELSGQKITLENANRVQSDSHQAEVNEMQRRLAEMDSSSASHKEQLASLTEKHDLKIAEIQSKLNNAAEEHEKERKSGAEVRDNLAAQLKELEAVRTSVPQLQAEVTKLNQRIATSRAEVHDLQGSLDQAHAELSEERTRTNDLREEIQSLQNELDNHIKHRASGADFQKLHTTALASLDKEKSTNTALRHQLEDAATKDQRHAARIKEVEAALKATRAEVVEMKTRATATKTPATAGLGGSKWATDDNEAPRTGEDVDEGAELQGTMAGIQAQLKALEAINEDMIDDHQRIVTNLLNRPSSSGTGKTSSSRTSGPALSAQAPAFSPGSP